MIWNIVEALAEMLKGLGILKQSTPDRMAIVTSGESNQYPTFSSASEALAYARSVISEQGGVFVLKVYGSDIPLPESEDIYDLRAEGIYWHVQSDAWRFYLIQGGDIADTDILYTILDSKLNIEVTG